MLRMTRGALPGFGGSWRRHLYRQAQRMQAAICSGELWTGLFMALTVVAAYDVSEDRRRARVAAMLQMYGDRVQRSVFLLSLRAEQACGVAPPNRCGNRPGSRLVPTCFISVLAAGRQWGARDRRSSLPMTTSGSLGSWRPTCAYQTVETDFESRVGRLPTRKGFGCVGSLTSGNAADQCADAGHLLGWRHRVRKCSAFPQVRRPLEG